MTQKRFKQKTFTLTKILLAVGLLLTVFVLGIDVFLLIFAGILLSILLVTLSEALSDRTSLSRNFSLAIVVVVMLLFCAISSYFFFPSLAKQIDNLTEVLPQSIEPIQDFLYRYEWTRQLLTGADIDASTLTQGGFLSQLTGAASATINLIASFFIMMFIALYLAFEPETYLNGLIRLFPLERRERLQQVLMEVGNTLKWWLLGRIASMAIVGILTVVGLMILDIPMALSLGFIAGLLSFIPNIGPILSAVPAILIGFTISPQTALYVMALYMIVQAIENYLITPFIQQKTVNLPPALALAIQVIAGVLFGFLGLTLSAPLAAGAMVAINRLYIQDVLGDRRSHLF